MPITLRSASLSIGDLERLLRKRGFEESVDEMGRWPSGCAADGAGGVRAPTHGNRIRYKTLN
ncbi:MAG: hypothetical protein JWN40_1123 [Phycisphaerales bacterium]|nr:hypothetical protein [Phycisphaerales bacterium]